jgi:lipopolysaccharide biosynthesis glycosyltransferase
MLLNLFFAIDKNFIVPFTVTLTSVFENNKDVVISVYVICDRNDRDMLYNCVAFFKERYEATINVIVFDNNIFNNLPISIHISKAAYSRLLLAYLLPADIPYGLYLDCDIIVTGSLEELLEPDFCIRGSDEEYSLFAVEDKHQQEEVDRFKKTGITLEKYFNSGVLLINLNKWRRENATFELLKTAEKYKEILKWHDQDILNIYFKNNWGKLNNKFNKHVEKELSTLPVIIHFTGSSKPWHYLNRHPYKHLYRKYLNLTPFKTKKFEKITLKKIIKKLIRK